MTVPTGPPNPPDNPPPPAYGPPYGPPSQPYGSPYGPRRSGGRGATIVAAVLAGVFVVATAIAAVVAHNTHSTQLAGGGVSSAAVVPVLSDSPDETGGGNGPAVNGGASSPTLPSITPLPTPTISTPPPLDPEAINRVFQVYMNALLYHDLSGVKSATCPRLRNTETGTALNHHYIDRWKGNPYTIYPDLSYVMVTAVVTQADNGVKKTYQWQVDRYPDGQYWVCGFYG